MNNLKIGIVLSELEGITRSNGGVGRRYRLMIDALNEQGVEIVALVFNDNSNLGESINGVSVESVSHTLPNPIRNCYRVIYARLWLNKVEPSVILSPEWGGLCAFSPKQIPLVTNLVTSLRQIHEMNIYQRGRSLFQNINYKLQIYFEERQILRSKHLIAISSAIENWNRNFFGNLPKIEVITNTVSVDEGSSTMPSNIEELRGTNYLLFIGRFEHRKGVKEVLEVWPSIASLYPHLNLVLAGGKGDTVLEQKLEAQLLALPEQAAVRVKRLGVLDRSSLRFAIEHATIVLTPSTWEAFGNATAEAMSLGASVIATKGSGFDDYCKHLSNSYLISPSNSAELQVAILELLNNDQLRDELGANARKIRTELSPTLISQRYLASLDDVAKRSSRND